MTTLTTGKDGKATAKNLPLDSTELWKWKLHTDMY